MSFTILNLNTTQRKPRTKTVKTVEQHVSQPSPIIEENDDQIIERLRHRFTILDDMTKAVKKGHIRSMIVSGPPGVGKSFGIENILASNKLFDDIKGVDHIKKYEIIKGTISPIKLYTKLYEFSDSKSVLVADDADGLFYDQDCLNLLKGALDSSKVRTISWLTDSKLLKGEGIPNSFEFKGGMIFITNLKFDMVKSDKLREHLYALESRSHYIDLTINTQHEKMLRIKQIVNDGMLDDYQLDFYTKQMIINYVDQHKDQLRELSLRTVIKVADLAQSFPTSWQEKANITILKKR